MEIQLRKEYDFHPRSAHHLNFNGNITIVTNIPWIFMQLIVLSVLLFAVTPHAKGRLYPPPLPPLPPRCDFNLKSDSKAAAITSSLEELSHDGVRLN